jgi:hypothetical protein
MSSEYILTISSLLNYPTVSGYKPLAGVPIRNGFLMDRKVF